MPAAACTKPDSGPPRRSPRFKNIHIIYEEDSDKDSSTFKCVKTEVIDLEEITSPSTSELNIASVNDKDGEQDFQNVSLRDLRAQCKTKNRKASKVMLEGSGTKIQTEKTEEGIDLHKPLIALKQKRQKVSSAKAKRKMDGLSFAPCAVEVADITLKRCKTPSPAESSLLKATMHDPAIGKLEKRPTDLEHSKSATDCTKEIGGEQICSAEVEYTVGSPVSWENSDVLCEIKKEDIDYSEEVGTSSCCENIFSEHLYFELQPELAEGDECITQPCVMNQPTISANVSDQSLEQTCREYSYDDIATEKATEIVSSSGFINEVTFRQETLENITYSDLDKSSIENEFLVRSINQSCNDLIDNNECQNTGVVQGNETETVKILEELCPIEEFTTEMVSPLVAIQSDLCGSKEMTCTSLKNVVQVQAEGQLDSVVCCSVRPKQMLVDMETRHAFTFDKIPDLTQPANLVVQDGRLESVVCDVLNNHGQSMASESESSVGQPDAAVIQSPVIDFTDKCSDEKRVSDDSKTSLPNNMDFSLKDMNTLSSTIDYSICKFLNNGGSEEELMLQPQLFQDGTDKFDIGGVTPDVSNAEETQEMSAGVPILFATSLETDERIKKSEFLNDKGSSEEQAPRKLLSKRKIMSPTSREKLCNALTGADSCEGVQRLKSTIILEDHDISRTSSPQTEHKPDRSLFRTDRGLKGRTSVSPTSKGVLKSAESRSDQQTCSCLRKSPVVLDTEKAVEFSQRQMHDIENIAAKLIRSLKHMRSIVDGNLSSEAYSLLPNFNLAEIKAASEDALEVEKTTRKWLAIMNKDCNRFCKILTLAKRNDVPNPEAPRKQRKITFADEAGGKLCHVNVFNDGQISLLSESQSDS